MLPASFFRVFMIPHVLQTFAFSYTLNFTSTWSDAFSQLKYFWYKHSQKHMAHLPWWKLKAILQELLFETVKISLTGGQKYLLYIREY